jgi:branched-chain amino acid aminotransferase
MNSEPIVYLDGDYVPLSGAKISILDQGFLLGDGIFDVVSVWRGTLFKLDQHIERFFLSLRATAIVSRLSPDGWREVIIETVRRNGLADASVRFIATRGVTRAIGADPREHQPTEIVWVAPYVFLADERKRREGIRLGISHLRGFSPDTLDPRYKALDRLHFQLARLEGLDAGYDAVIWLNAQGYVAEGPSSNVFLVRDGVLYTPGDQILRGITRQTMLECAERAGIPWREANLTAFDLYCADEVFTTSTAGGALAVREVAGRPLPAAPGPVTRRLDQTYWAMREAGEHGTPVR